MNTALKDLGIKVPAVRLRLPQYTPPPFVPRHLRANAFYAAMAGALQQVGKALHGPQVLDALDPTAQVVFKATQGPAQSDSPGYAAELVRDVHMALYEDLARGCLLLKLAGTPMTWDGFANILMPMRKARSPAEKTLAASFRAEGQPIRIGGVPVIGKKLKPHSLGVIATWTSELADMALEDIAALCKTWVIEDTNTVIDSLAWSSSPASPVQPAGLLAGLPLAQRVVSTGTTLDDLRGDMSALMGAFINTGPGKGLGVFLMHPSRLIALQTATDPTTSMSVYPEVQHGVLQRLPILTSLNFPPSTVVLLDQTDVRVAMEFQGWKSSVEATLQEDDTLPLPLSAGSTTRSLFQTNAQALRAVWSFDAMLAHGRCAYIQGATW